MSLSKRQQNPANTRTIETKFNVPPGAPLSVRTETPKDDCESLVYVYGDDEKLVQKEEKKVSLSLKAFGMMKQHLGAIKGKNPFRTRFASALSAVALSSGVGTAKVSWDPSSNGEFTDFALLFSQYKVESVKITVWFPNESSAAGTGTSIFLIGADPGMVVTGTPTASGVSDLTHSARWNTIVSMKSAPTFVADAHDAPLARNMQGFIDTTSSWVGQTVIYSQSSATSTLNAFNYQVMWNVSFCNRF